MSGKGKKLKRKVLFSRRFRQGPFSNNGKRSSQIRECMKAYASVKEVTSGSGDYLSAKDAADKIAKSISDKYAQSLQYKYGMRDLEDADKEIKNTKDAKWDEFFKNSITSAQSGMITVNFSFAQLAGLSAEN